MDKVGQTVGIRELKNRLGHHIGRVKAGERLVVTDRGKPVAMLWPVSSMEAEGRIEAMLREGIARWNGGKPKGSPNPPRNKGKTVSSAVLEDRR